jgi:hypothetical protein
VVLGALVPLAACGTSAIGVDICDSIETARCNRAVLLGCLPDLPDSDINLSVPPHPDDNASACIEYYKVACLHGLVTSTLPEGGQVTECVDFISQSATCPFVAQPQTADACAWLIPPAVVADSGDASDARESGDASDASDGG